MKVLVIEDDPAIGRILQLGLEARNNTVEVCSDGLEGARRATESVYDVIIADQVLPSCTGTEICRRIREKNVCTPILILSQQNDSHTKIRALCEGADDYITKPFCFEEICARLSALRRRPRQIDDTTYTHGPIKINTSSQTVMYKNERIYMTRREYELIVYLIKNKGRIIKRSQLIDNVWDASIDAFSNTVESHIAMLRKKFCDDQKKLITTIPGLGYTIPLSID